MNLSSAFVTFAHLINFWLSEATVLVLREAQNRLNVGYRSQTMIWNVPPTPDITDTANKPTKATGKKAKYKMLINKFEIFIEYSLVGNG